MSGSPVNLQRDSMFRNTEEAAIQFGGGDLFNETTKIRTNADPTVYDDYAKVRSSRAQVFSLAATLVYTLGLYLRPPEAGLSPYRIKAYVGCDDPVVKFHIVMGFAPTTITGSNDDIDVYETLNFQDHFDDLIMLPQEAIGTHSQFIGIMIKGETSGSVIVNASLSAQRLATSPPQFSQSVS